jgi:tRNA A37 threonylcarbamoyltransferase TsaD
MAGVIQQSPVHGVSETIPSVSSISSENNSISSSSSSSSFSPNITFPFLTLLVSGGHTSIVLCHSLGDYEFLGGTLDDSLGESLDKAARLLGITGFSSGGEGIEAYTNIYYEKYYHKLVPSFNETTKKKEKGLPIIFPSSVSNDGMEQETNEPATFNCSFRLPLKNNPKGDNKFDFSFSGFFFSPFCLQSLVKISLILSFVFLFP